QNPTGRNTQTNNKDRSEGENQTKKYPRQSNRQENKRSKNEQGPLTEGTLGGGPMKGTDAETTRRPWVEPEVWNALSREERYAHIERQKEWKAKHSRFSQN